MHMIVDKAQIMGYNVCVKANTAACSVKQGVTICTHIITDRTAKDGGAVCFLLPHGFLDP